MSMEEVDKKLTKLEDMIKQAGKKDKKDVVISGDSSHLVVESTPVPAPPERPYVGRLNKDSGDFERIGPFHLRRPAKNVADAEVEYNRRTQLWREAGAGE